MVCTGENLTKHLGEVTSSFSVVRYLRVASEMDEVLPLLDQPLMSYFYSVSSSFALMPGLSYLDSDWLLGTVYGGSMRT